jgi:hypothetical protein
MEKAVIAYLHEAAGQDMLQEAVHAFFAVLEKDTAILDLDDSRVGNGNPEDVRGKILEAMFLSRYGLGVDFQSFCQTLSWISSSNPALSISYLNFALKIFDGA